MLNKVHVHILWVATAEHKTLINFKFLKFNLLCKTKEQRNDMGVN